MATGVGTMAFVPQVVDAVAPTPVLAAGDIVRAVVAEAQEALRAD